MREACATAAAHVQLSRNRFFVRIEARQCYRRIGEFNDDTVHAIIASASGLQRGVGSDIVQSPANRGAPDPPPPQRPAHN
ncbi:MAG TPA: hypothetical protein VMW17_05690 [Candidatus Binatia bacterium]|nr:hypothetical protein [Candidatus Binatia bacterium]